MMECPKCGSQYPKGSRVCSNDKAVLRPLKGAIDPLVGQVLKDVYRLEERIGSGGMSTIYRGTQVMIDRPVAVKVLLPHLQPDTTFVKRFFREAHLLGRLSHPNIVSIYDAGQTDDGLVYLVTEFLEGAVLSRVIPPRVGLPFREILDVMRAVCSAVAEAHAHQVIHRDLKPSNVFVLKTEGRSRQVKVLDFGIAKSLESHAAELTKAGAFVGTPGYMAPEQVKTYSTIDHRADIYALGALLYLMAAGQPAFNAEGSTERVRQQLEGRVAPVDFASLGKPQELSAVIHKALQVDPEQRYASALEFMDALEHCADRYGSRGARAAIGEMDPTMQDAAYSAERIALWKPSERDASRGSLEKTKPIDLPVQLRRERRLNRVMLVALTVALGGASFLLYRVVQLTRTETAVVEIEAATPIPP